ncbi:NAD(P)H-binding protein [Amycolatopsis circi]|uniref:NAD(P)H-binding protein n=1 Tax=Amycolatopsis circi TaxID=871959 RepID=UPI000E27B96F|nr:NAD(P)H-binding protein [Amycolatopsis circi]
MTILITGARGGIGASLLRRLTDVRAASRAPQQLGFPAVELDLAKPATFAPALAGITAVFLYAEPTGIEELLDAAVSAGVQRIVLLSSDSVTSPDAEHNALARHHFLVEQALLATPLTSTVLRPGGFATMTLGWAESVRAGQPVGQAYPDARLDVIHPEDIADVAELALSTDALNGETISLGGPEVLSFRDQAKILAEVLGKEIELREPTRREAVQQLPAPLAEAILDYWAQLPGESDRSVERITGRPGRTFRQWAMENVAAFR